MAAGPCTTATAARWQSRSGLHSPRGAASNHAPEGRLQGSTSSFCTRQYICCCGDCEAPAPGSRAAGASCACSGVATAGSACGARCGAANLEQPPLEARFAWHLGPDREMVAEWAGLQPPGLHRLREMPRSIHLTGCRPFLRPAIESWIGGHAREQSQVVSLRFPCWPVTAAATKSPGRVTEPSIVSTLWTDHLPLRRL